MTEQEILDEHNKYLYSIMSKNSTISCKEIIRDKSFIDFYGIEIYALLKYTGFNEDKFFINNKIIFDSISEKISSKLEYINNVKNSINDFNTNKMNSKSKVRELQKEILNLNIGNEDDSKVIRKKLKLILKLEKSIINLRNIDNKNIQYYNNDLNWQYEQLEHLKKIQEILLLKFKMNYDSIIPEKEHNKQQSRKEKI